MLKHTCMESCSKQIPNGTRAVSSIKKLTPNAHMSAGLPSKESSCNVTQAITLAHTKLRKALFFYMYIAMYTVPEVVADCVSVHTCIASGAVNNGVPQRVADALALS